MLSVRSCIVHRTTIWLSREVRSQLKTESERTGVSAAEWIRRAITDRMTQAPLFRRAEVIAERHHQDPSEIMNLCCEIGLSVYETNPALQPVPRGDDSVPDPRPTKTRKIPVAPGDESPKSRTATATTAPRRPRKIPVDLTPDPVSDATHQGNEQ
jgi:predicted DNA-binding protein